MFEGRSALPRTNQPTVSSSNHGNDSANHKQLIDRIRSKDSNGLIELMESGELYFPFLLWFTYLEFDLSYFIKFFIMSGTN